MGKTFRFFKKNDVVRVKGMLLLTGVVIMVDLIEMVAQVRFENDNKEKGVGWYDFKDLELVVSVYGNRVKDEIKAHDWVKYKHTPFPLYAIVKELNKRNNMQLDFLKSDGSFEKDDRWYEKRLFTKLSTEEVTRYIPMEVLNPHLRELNQKVVEQLKMEGMKKMKAELTYTHKDIQELIADDVEKRINVCVPLDKVHMITFGVDGVSCKVEVEV